jgi:pyoverdine/dityrosine biosynthesis protein Dit1
MLHATPRATEPQVGPETTTIADTAERILALVLRYGNCLDASRARGERHLPKILRALRGGDPIDLVLPAFPAKSPNREKTLGSLPDYAEVLGLERLQKICDEIRTLHAPGARVLVCSDGRVFSDLVLVSDEEVSEYGRAVRCMIQDLGLRSLRTFSMEDVFGDADFETMRMRLVRELGRSVEEIRADVRANAEALAMFNGIHRFLFEDRLVLDRGKSRNRVREECKELAYQVIQRSNAWSSLVEELFPHALRLSIHPQFAHSPKIGFRLVDCDSAWGTPWHNVALLDRGGFRLVKRRDAEARGAVLTLAHGKYPFYKELALL